ncbi:MAG: DUF4388 domain-containing protein [Thermoanaerobaculia bacterium]|nr:DUF4388 domain-containing protein [Thermoanaerobaculia bacterium]
MSVADLLQWASNDGRTGALVFRTSSREKEVFFQEGAVVGATSDDPKEYFGQFLLLEGYLTEDQLLEVLTWCRETQRRLGVGLVELGILPEGEAQDALRRKIEDTVCDLFLWDHGVFYFAQRMPRQEELLPQPIHTVGLAMEGARWEDEEERIRRVFVHDEVGLCRGSRWPGSPEDPRQDRILETFEEGITIGELYERVKGSRFRFLEAAFDLTVQEVLDIESVGEGGARGSSTEIRIFDLLMEQAAQEEVLFSRRHLSLPLEVLDEFYPVWMEPESREMSLPSEVEAFRRRMDGSVSLRSLIMEEGADRGRRMEILLLELRKGNLVLLPRPRSEMDSSEEGRGEGWLGRILGRG